VQGSVRSPGQRPEHREVGEGRRDVDDRQRFGAGRDRSRGAQQPFGQVVEKAELDAIGVFARNLKALLLAAPAGQRATMGLDPGLRTGVKVAVVDATGKVVELDGGEA